jgi:hypothetical protein
MKSKDIKQIYGQYYYHGQLLKVEDFERERDYHDAQRALKNCLTFTSGILLGLEVTAEGSQIHISAGTAIDAQGQLILLADCAKWNDTLLLKQANESIPLDLSSTIYHNKIWQLIIQWGRDLDPQDGSQTHATPILQVIPVDSANIPTTPDII